MRALLLKELQLVVHPSTYVMVLLGALVLIPNWPYAIVLLYGILTAFFNAMNAREMRDLAFSFSLPVSRRSLVRARVVLMCAIELAMLGIMAACICLRPVLGINEVAAGQPLAGFPANVALLGFAFAAFGIFNAVFFPLHYKDPAKIGVPFMIACIPVAVFAIAFEALPFIPGELSAVISSPGFGNLTVQAVALVAGAVLFAVLSFLAMRLAAHAFGTYDC